SFRVGPASAYARRKSLAAARSAAPPPSRAARAVASSAARRWSGAPARARARCARSGRRARVDGHANAGSKRGRSPVARSARAPRRARAAAAGCRAHGLLPGMPTLPVADATPDHAERVGAAHGAVFQQVDVGVKAVGAVLRQLPEPRQAPLELL